MVCFKNNSYFQKNKEVTDNIIEKVGEVIKKEPKSKKSKNRVK